MKTTYIYRIELGHNGKIERTEFCYARNKRTAEAYYKEKYHQEKYNTFKAIAFGDTDRHRGPIEELPPDELNYLMSHNIGKADAYSNRIQNVPSGGTIIPASEVS